MRKPVLIGIGIAAFLASAAVLRLHDAPYIDYIKGQRAAAVDGLIRKAAHGDGFAALLVARNYAQDVMGVANREKAIDWYLIAARSNEIRAIVPFIDLTLAQAGATPDRCRVNIQLLDLVGRTGELAALITLGRWYQIGLCVDADLVMATRYYMGATRADGRFYELVDALAEQVGPDTVRELTPRPEKFDVAHGVALAQFLADAPALR